MYQLSMYLEYFFNIANSSSIYGFRCFCRELVLLPANYIDRRSVFYYHYFFNIIISVIPWLQDVMVADTVNSF